MEKDYVPRRTPSTPARRRQPTRGGRNNRRRSSPPPILPIGIFLVAVIILVIVLVSVFGGKKDDNKSDPGSGSSQLSSQLSSPSSSPSSSQLSSAEVEPTMPPEKKPAQAPEKLDALVQVGDTGYEYYNFVTDTANKYITMVSKAGQELKGSATLYDMIIPTSMDIMLPESYIQDNEINSSDQKKAIEYMYSSINAQNPDVKTVSIFDTLKLHSNEYIYFRTDHHWTQLGAYYAYQEFCKAKGIEPTPLDSYNKKSYDGFLGSFYSDTQSSAMAANPDTVEAYISGANANLSYTTIQGETISQWPVIQDGSSYDPEYLYLIFIAGDQPYEEITNSDITDGSSCIVVKESFGNAFVPFLVDHYQTIYVLDYRYYDGNIADLAKQKGATDVIMLNNISMTRNADLVDSISGKF